MVICYILEKTASILKRSLFYSVLGPALTFRLGPNPKNVTTADLVQVAGKSLTHSDEPEAYSC